MEEEKGTTKDMITVANLFEFSAVYGTGERWFLNILRRCGLGQHDVAQALKPFGSENGLIRVSMVRSPFTWLETVYQPGGNTPFIDFVEQYLRKPQSFSDLIFDKEADTYMRYEDQPIALKEFLGSFRVDMNGAAGPPEPVVRVVWPKYLRIAVAEKDHKLIDQFDYWR